MIRDAWEKMTPKTKRIVVIAGSIAVLFLVVKLFGTGDSERKPRNSREDSIRHILTDRSTREVGIDGLSADVRLVSRDNAELRKELERLKDELKTKAADTGTETSRTESRQMARDLERLQGEVKELTELLTNQNQAAAEGDTEEDGADTTGSTAQASEAALSETNPEDFFRNAPSPGQTSVDAEGKRGEPARPSTLVISSYSSSTGAEDDEYQDEAKDDEIYMPAGSILTGVLINGMDAPTASGARQDPFPATLRIQKEAILPNRFRADIRECFLIVSGYGDLSSERAYLRGETLSCIKDNGEVIEARLDSYAVGEDGKAGVRGRLVSKQGQMIARSLMAGFMAGAAEAFDVSRVPTLNLDSGGRASYQRNDFSSTLLQGSAARGASTALDRIAEFYIDMAEGIFPVIEVDAGRQIEIIISKGSSLRVRGSKAD